MKSAEPCEVQAHQLTWEHKCLHCLLCKKNTGSINFIKWKGTIKHSLFGGPIPFDDMVRPWRTPCKNTVTLWQHTSLSKWRCYASLCQFLPKLTEACILLCWSISFNTPITRICELSSVNATAGHARHAVQLTVIADSCVLGWCTERLPLQVTRVSPFTNRLYF